MSVIAKAIADRQSEIERLQAEIERLQAAIKPLNDVDTVLAPAAGHTPAGRTARPGGKLAR